MFDKLDDLLRRFEEIMNELAEPGVTDNQKHFRELMKEQSDLTPLVEAYKEYKNAGRMWRILWQCWRRSLMRICGIC